MAAALENRMDELTLRGLSGYGSTLGVIPGTRQTLHIFSVVLASHLCHLCQVGGAGGCMSCNGGGSVWVVGIVPRSHVSPQAGPVAIHESLRLGCRQAGLDGTVSRSA